MSHKGQSAESLGITPEQLVQANVEDMLAQPQEDFQQALRHAFEKNEELYKTMLPVQDKVCASARHG